jgi:acyl-coenzyme A synthetase/AMP-(fatty) acid ligase
MIELYHRAAYVSPGELRDRVFKVQSQLRLSSISSVAVQVEDGCDLVTALLACRSLGIEMIIVSPWLPRNAVEPLGPDCWLRMDEGDIGPVVLETGGGWGRPPVGAASNSNGVTVFSSGSTGVPKATRWTWEALGRPQTVADGREVWGIGYAPFTFAGVTATCQALQRAKTLEYIRPADLACSARREPFDVVAGTPSYWRMAVVALRTNMSTPRSIRVATLGGEPVDEALISLIHATFAPGRIKQIFGTTEFGTLLSIDDEFPGLPSSLVGHRLPNGIAFDVRDGRLRFSTHPDAPFIETGDLAIVSAGRIHIVGRVGQLINVGGHKVSPIHVSQVINQNPKIVASRAYPISSPLLGNVVGIDVIPFGMFDLHELIADIKSYAGRHLTPPERPRRVRVTDSLTVAPSGKLRFNE